MAAGQSISGGKRSVVLAVAKQYVTMWRSEKLPLPVAGMLVRKWPMEAARVQLGITAVLLALMALRLAAIPVMATIAAARPLVRQLGTEVTATATEQRPGAYTNKAAYRTCVGRCKKRRRRPGLLVATRCSELTIVAAFKEHGIPAAASFPVSITASTFIFAPDTFLTHCLLLC